MSDDNKQLPHRFTSENQPVNRGRPAGRKDEITVMLDARKELMGTGFRPIPELVNIVQTTKKESIKVRAIETIMKHCYPTYKSVDVEVTEAKRMRVFWADEIDEDATVIDVTPADQVEYNRRWDDAFNTGELEDVEPVHVPIDRRSE